MKIEQAKIDIRPRSPWEAMDLGILFAKRYFSLLMRTWFVCFLPIYITIAFLLWNYPYLIILAIWWLKPIFDRVPLYILSKTLFSDPPSIKETVAFWWKSLKHRFFSDLLFRRISLARSYLLPIYQLEQLPKKSIQKRKRYFLNKNSKEFSLTFLYLIVEISLWFGMISFIYFMIPNNFLPESLTLQNIPPLFIHLIAFIYFCVLSLTETLYISSGFMLYLNRRIINEGWDIELGFTKMLNRLTSSLMILIAASILLFSIPNHAYAQEALPHLIEQSLDKIEIERILDDEPFKETKTSYSLKSKKETPKKDEILPFNYNDFSFNPSLFGNGIQIILWSLAAVFIALLLYYARHLLPLFKSWKINKDKSTEKIKKFQGFEITPEVFPTDVLAQFENLWLVNKRDALAFLYRYLISELVYYYDIPLKEFHTENEVLSLTKHLNKQDLTLFTQFMTKTWQKVAYGHYALLESDKAELLLKWRSFMALKNNNAKESS